MNTPLVITVIVVILALLLIAWLYITKMRTTPLLPVTPVSTKHFMPVDPITGKLLPVSPANYAMYPSKAMTTGSGNLITSHVDEEHLCQEACSKNKSCSVYTTFDAPSSIDNCLLSNPSKWPGLSMAYANGIVTGVKLPSTIPGYSQRDSYDPNLVYG